MKLKSLILLLYPILTYLYLGCTSKTTSYITNIHLFQEKNNNKEVEKNFPNKELLAIAQKIKQEKSATLFINKVPLKNNEHNLSTSLYLTPTYLKIVFPDKSMFTKGSTLLNSSASSSVKKIIPYLQSYKNIVIQVIGHAYQEGNSKQMQHLSDYRAISVAELLFNNGLKQDILAKGCSDFVPFKICTNPTNQICQQQNRNIDIFIYTNKNDVITKCR